MLKWRALRKQRYQEWAKSEVKFYREYKIISVRKHHWMKTCGEVTIEPTGASCFERKEIKYIIMINCREMTKFITSNLNMVPISKILNFTAKTKLSLCLSRQLYTLLETFVRLYGENTNLNSFATLTVRHFRTSLYWCRGDDGLGL
jgi:hypothetical protein